MASEKNPARSLRVGPASLVRIEYELSTDDEILETTAATGALEIRLGSGRLHPVLEQRIQGLVEGAEFRIGLDPSLAFGEVDPKLKVSLRRAQLPVDMRDLSVGAEFETKGPDGKPRVFRVTAVSDERMEIDGNSPYAGQAVTVEGRILAVLE
jgi:FKBP-type peptidyl-prolyl cis-trans isomerase SlyD